jgi:hypothetical protein
MLAAAFGVQAVLIGGSLVLTLIAVLTFSEARAVDLLPRLRATHAVGRLTANDEPVSPNP